MAHNSYIVHAIAGLHPKSGGPSRTVVALAESTAKLPDLDVAIVTQSMVGEPIRQPKSGLVESHVCYTENKYSLLLGLPLKRGLKQIIKKRKPDILHSHGIWLPSDFWTTRAAIEKKIVHILHPRGTLEPWSLAYRKYKKKVAMYAYQMSNLKSMNAFIATSDNEISSIRDLGLKQPVALIPNGVASIKVQIDELHDKRANNVTRTALYLSRIHKKKGLMDLINAWATIKPANWRLIIAGPDDGGYLNEVIRSIQHNNLESTVSYVGVVDGLDKTELYLKSDLFVLPTYSENFGMVIAEALAHGLPVITRKGAPWSDLKLYGCGWWIENDNEVLVSTLRNALELDAETLRDMGTRGYVYSQLYDWGDIAIKTRDTYRWLLGYGDLPGFVYL